MINKNILKEIIVSNEEFILDKVKNIEIRDGVSIPKTLNKVVVFYGVRRSGKTFILFDLYKKYKDRSLYIDFEDDRLSEFKISDFEALKDAFLELKPNLISKEIVFLLDEVQNIKGWEKFCRRAVERENIKVCVTGSSSKIMSTDIHTELRGRAWSIEVWPFSFKEYLNFKNIDINNKTFIYGQKKTLIKKHFSDFLKWGGFPEVSILPLEFEKTKLLKDYMEAMYFRDLVERYNITNIPLLENMHDKLFSSFSLKFSLTSFYKQYKDKFPFSKDLLFRYYKYFIQSMLIFEVKKFAKSVYKRMRNPSKIYLVDTGLCKRVISNDLGRLLENIVFLELKRLDYELFYFEEKKECDFIAKDVKNNLIPIQVSFELNEGNSEREINGLIEACNWLKKKEGLILTFDEEKELLRDEIKIIILPVWKWLLYSGRS